MANIQKQLEQFDSNIRLKRFNENAMLIEKRDAILRRLRDRFAAMRREGKTVPTFNHLNQGSYEMGTGIKPADGEEYDIDVGLRFNCAKSDYPNPVDLKCLVADSLEGHTEIGTVIRRSCVTVYYKLGGEQAYHVDLAVYAYDNPDSPQKQLFIAKGKRGSDEANRDWETSDPLGLSDWVENRFPDEAATTQYLRVIRALKRWKTEKFKTDGNNAPSGIGLTVAAGHWFQAKFVRNAFANTVTFDDLSAMRSFVDAMIKQFQAAPSEEGAARYRLVVNLPVPSHANIFERMSPGQMTTFRERLLQLRERLDKVSSEADPIEACKMMRQDFGKEFPVPDKGDTGQTLGRAISTGGISA
jgi:hypothetical protein